MCVWDKIQGVIVGPYGVAMVEVTGGEEVKEQRGQVLNELSVYNPATSKHGDFVQIRKCHLFLKILYHHLSKLSK